MSPPTIDVVNSYRNFFVRNKDHSILLRVLKENRERVIVLNTHHNIIEITYFTGEWHRGRGTTWEKTSVDWFGVSYEILDALFDKYKNDKVILTKLAKFCMRSKSKSYWYKLKDTPLAKEVMASMLGGPDENT